MTPKQEEKIIKDYKSKKKISYIPKEVTLRDMISYLDGWYYMEKINKSLESGFFQKTLF